MITETRRQIESTGERLTIAQREEKALAHIADKLAHYAEQLIILDNRTASLCLDAAISAIETHTHSLKEKRKCPQF